MRQRPLFKLDGRLALCAEFVRQDCRLADIGTDHAYLPVWLVRSGRIQSAVAADLKEAPLQRGKDMIVKYHVQDRVSTRLSDGLAKISPRECDDIVLAGMGGELIVQILSAASWIKDKSKRLILQPMSKAEVLRGYLFENGFAILREKAVLADGKIYTVLQCAYSGRREKADDSRLYCGGLHPKENKLDRLYIEQAMRHLQKKADGLFKAGQAGQARMFANLVLSLQKTL